MALEIERKFLVADDSWRSAVSSSTAIMQGYLAATGRAAVRVRVRGEQAFLTIKGVTSEVTRTEYEYPIPLPDAAAMLQELAEGPIIEKVRHIVPVGDHEWELDVFAGDNEGLVMAEIELDDPDEPFVTPDWVGEEVSDDPRYFNVNLAAAPYRTWGAEH
jgi:adenylate cyclase